MKGLRPFRQIPKTLREWSRWMSEQEIPEGEDIEITESQITDLQDYVTTSTIRSGYGVPTNVVQGNLGDLYLNLSGGTSTTLYVKETGGPMTSTGWVAK